MNNRERVANLIGVYCCGYCDHFGEEQAQALHEAGLLMPDLPKMSGDLNYVVSDVTHTVLDNAVVNGCRSETEIPGRVFVVADEILFDVDHGEQIVTADEARRLGATLIAAAEWSERAQ